MEEGTAMIVRQIINIVLIGGTLWVTWELARAARVMATPPFKDAQTILAGIRDLQGKIEAVRLQLDSIAGGESDPINRHQDESPIN